MRTTSLLGSIPKSFYSRDFYREVGREWSGFGFGYLLVAISAFVLPIAVVALLYSFTLTLDKSDYVNSVINQVPELTIQKGEISTKVPMPHYIRDKETGHTLAIIDTTRSVTDWSQQMKDYKVLAIIGKNQILLNKSEKTGEKRLYDIPEDTNMVVTSDVVRGWVTKFLGYAWALVLFVTPFVILTWFVFRIVLMFLYGILGKIINLILKMDLSYTECVRLASVSTTATLALFTLSNILAINFSGWTHFALNTVYLFCAIRANKA
jgi:hypothetical protein